MWDTGSCINEDSGWWTCCFSSTCCWNTPSSCIILSIKLDKSWSIWNSSVGNIFLLGSIFLEVISILLMFFLSMDFTVMNGTSLPNTGIWVHWSGSWVIISTSYMWEASTCHLGNCGWETCCFSSTCCWNTPSSSIILSIKLNESWSIWNSSVGNIFLLGSIFLEVISIILMFFLTMDFTVMECSSLPNIGIWVHACSTWVVFSTT